MKKILLAGSTGFIGSNILSHLSKRHLVMPVNRTNLASGKYFEELNEFNAEYLVYAAGQKNIAFCEKNKKEALDANFDFLIKLINAFPSIKIVYLSTDYVFSGNSGNYTITSKVDPITFYGQSKCIAENYLLSNKSDFSTILRTAAVFNMQSLFVKNIFWHHDQKKPLDICDDSFFSPTPLNLLLNFIEFLLDHFFIGIHHLCGKKHSRFSFAENVSDIFNLNLDYNVVPRDSINKFLMPDLSMRNSFIDEKWKNFLPKDLYQLNFVNAHENFTLGDFK